MQIMFLFLWGISRGGGNLVEESISAEHKVGRIQKTVAHNHLGDILLVLQKFD